MPCSRLRGVPAYLGQNIQPDMYKDLMSMPSLKYVHVGYGSRKKNEEFNALVLRSGKQTGTNMHFAFR